MYITIILSIIIVIVIVIIIILIITERLPQFLIIKVVAIYAGICMDIWAAHTCESMVFAPLIFSFITGSYNVRV